MAKKYKATEEQFRKALLKWLDRQHQQLCANIHGDDDASLWCKEEAELVEEHIRTVEGLIFVNEALKASADEAHRQADLAYDRIEELDAKLAKANDRIQGLKELLWAAEKDANEAEAYAGEQEAKLAKAVVALDKIKRIDNLVGVFAACERTIAELTGGKDE